MLQVRCVNTVWKQSRETIHVARWSHEFHGASSAVSAPSNILESPGRVPRSLAVAAERPLTETFTRRSTSWIPPRSIPWVQIPNHHKRFFFTPNTCPWSNVCFSLDPCGSALPKSTDTISSRSLDLKLEARTHLFNDGNVQRQVPSCSRQ